MFKRNHLILVIFPLVFFGLYLLYWELILRDPILGYDDHTLIYPLYLLKSPFEYRPFIDVQPIRDLSYLWDIFLHEKLSFSTFHLTNTFIWGLTCILFFALFRSLDVSVIPSLLLMGIVAFHPIYANSVAWLAARKHLLATFFILLNTLTYMEMEKRGVKRHLASLFLAFVYSLSIFSQPITLLWPLWAFIWSYCRRDFRRDEVRSIFIFLLPTFIMMALAGYINLYYYLVEKYGKNFSAGGGNPKFLGFSGDVMWQILMAYGRYFYNLIFPFFLSIKYRVFSWPNITGFILFSAWILSIIRFLRFKTYFPWLSFFFLHLALVTFNMTHVFTSDSYILTSSFAFFYLTFLLLRELRRALANRGINTRMFAPLAALIVVFIYQTRITLIPWQSTLGLYKNAHENEPTDWTRGIYLMVLLKNPYTKFDYAETLSLVNQMKEKLFTDLFLNRMLTNPGLSSEKKIALLTKLEMETSLRYYYFTELYLEKGQLEQARLYLKNYLDLVKDNVNMVTANKERIDELRKIVFSSSIRP